MTAAPTNSVSALISSFGERSYHVRSPCHSASAPRRTASFVWATDPIVISYSQPFPLFQINDD